MDIVQCIDFDEVQLTARKIDNGVNFLEKKLINVSSVGLSVNPEETKAKAQNVLRDFEDEVEERKSYIDTYIETRKVILQKLNEKNRKISEFLQQTNNEMKSIELRLRANRNYQEYQVSPNEDSTNSTESLLEKNNFKLSCTLVKADDSNTEILETMDADLQNDKYSLITSSSNSTRILENNRNKSIYLSTPLSLSNSRVVNYKKSNCKELEKNTEKSLSETCNNSVLFSLRKKSNYVDDTCKTPVDPGISVISMQLLEKTNIKTKVYKNDELENRENDQLYF